MSGAVDPRGRTDVRVPAGHDPARPAVIALPLARRVETGWAWGGWAAPWAVLAAAAGLWALPAMPAGWSESVVRRLSF